MASISHATIGALAEDLAEKAGIGKIDPRLTRRNADSMYQEMLARVLQRGVRVFYGDALARHIDGIPLLPLLKKARELPLQSTAGTRRFRVFGRLMCRSGRAFDSFRGTRYTAKSPWISEADLVWLKLITRI